MPVSAGKPARYIEGTDVMRKIIEGKTKVIYDAGCGTVLAVSKDDITAGDGLRRDVLAGKAACATRTTSNVFAYLAARGVPTHFMYQVDERTFRAREVEMIPLELVARRVAAGSYLKRRPDVAEGTIFDQPVVEFFEKDDALHDPLLVFDLAAGRILRYDAKRPVGAGFIDEQAIAGGRFSMVDWRLAESLAELTARVFLLLEEAWARQDVTLVDLKIECGFDAKNGQLLVADVVDNDNWRIWPGGRREAMLDKQIYREADPDDMAGAMVRLAENYAWVAEATAAF